MKDVYKRQVFHKNNLGILSADLKNRPYIRIKCSCSHCMGRDPVSYTHLDVYKRQVK